MALVGAFSVITNLRMDFVSSSNTRPSLVHVVILVSDWPGRGGGGVAAGYRGAGELRPVPHQGGVQRGHQEPGAEGGIQGELGLVVVL